MRHGCYGSRPSARSCGTFTLIRADMRLRSEARRVALVIARTAFPLGLVAAPLTGQPFYGQSFTAPAAPNTLLQSLTVGPTGFTGAAAPTPWIANIYAYNGSALVGSSLFSQALGTSFAGFTLAPNLTLTAGGMYAVVVQFVLSSGGVVLEAPADTYAGGAAISCNVPPSCAPLDGTRDLAGFSTQLGPAMTSVPEPSTWMLLGTGIVGIGGLSMRRRRRA
jgi:hypothetical protein